MNNMLTECDVAVIGSGMGSLATASLLAKDGLKVQVLEQNYLPGGCTSSYWRKGFVFESGATTLVGLDEHMPLKHILDETGIKLSPVKLDLPMLVHLSDGTTIRRYQDLNQWIQEAQRVFGRAERQRKFWLECKEISDFVWETSLQHRRFPPTKLSDLWNAAVNARPHQLVFARYALVSMESFLKKYGLDDDERFVSFVNEQLLITAQNYPSEVNVLFGATALCYTNYDNYYMNGGLLQLVQPFVDYLEDRGSNVALRTPVSGVWKEKDGYKIEVGKKDPITIKSKYIVSGIPINNTLPLLKGEWGDRLQDKYEQKKMGSAKLNSAFQMGIGFKVSPDLPKQEAIHQQIHLDKPLPETGSDSIFLSLSHPDDPSRADDPNHAVASVSTHVHDPANTIMDNKEQAEQVVIEKLVELGIFKKEDIVYYHSSTPKGWGKWTWREWGFVGGYPQYFKIKPWQMIDARLDGAGAYLCGDTTYPGQGIPGVSLSGIVAYEKLKADHL